MLGNTYQSEGDRYQHEAGGHQVSQEDEGHDEHSAHGQAKVPHQLLHDHLVGLPAAVME